MDVDDLIAILAAATAFVVAMGTLLGVVMPKLRAQDAAVADVGREVNTIHTIVNQQRTDAQNYSAALVAALVDAGVAIPVDQSTAHRYRPSPSALRPDPSTAGSEAPQSLPAENRHRAP